jgi:arylsulfatase A-like enzyme
MALGTGMKVVFILSDQHRADAAGCYGSPVVRTPNLDRLAARGMRFDRAYCQSPLCAPSRGSLMTGTHCHTCGLVTQKTPPRWDLPTLGTVFRDAGYATGAFGKMHIPGEDAEHDLGFSERGLRFYTRKVACYADTLPEERLMKYWAGGAGEWDMKNYNPGNRKAETESRKPESGSRKPESRPRPFGRRPRHRRAGLVAARRDLPAGAVCPPRVGQQIKRFNKLSGSGRLAGRAWPELHVERSRSRSRRPGYGVVMRALDLRVGPQVGAGWDGLTV